MAAVPSARWLKVRRGLCLLLTGRRAGLCGRDSSSRFYSGSAAVPEVEGAGATGTEEVVIPKKKTCDLERSE
uniref:Pentatricopeptide repeat domain 3 n=1 Tax=Phocoena sinus TaxID=42100 RepID=A0A8C9BNB0_PHOSS